MTTAVTGIGPAAAEHGPGTLSVAGGASRGG